MRRFDHRRQEWSIARARTWQQERQSNDTSVSWSVPSTFSQTKHSAGRTRCWTPYTCKRRKKVFTIRWSTKKRSCPTTWQNPAVYFEDALSSEDRRKLTQYCWFLITIHFCLRGQELQSTLKKTDIVIDEEQGVTSIRLRTGFLTKNSAGGINSREFGSAGRITDPKQVAAIKMLLEKTNPDLDRLFQRVHPSFHPSHQFWFIKAPLGHNLIGQMMARISEAASLSKRYTNHCLRATCITTLLKAGFNTQQVCEVSGHKNVASLQSYSRADAADRARMAVAIDEALKDEIPKPEESPKSRECSSKAVLAKKEDETKGPQSTSDISETSPVTEGLKLELEGKFILCGEERMASHGKTRHVNQIIFSSFTQQWLRLTAWWPSPSPTLTTTTTLHQKGRGCASRRKLLKSSEYWTRLLPA